MVTAPHRNGNQNQFIQPETPRPTGSSISDVQEKALAQLPAALTVDHLAQWYGTSRRTFDRDFTSAVGRSALQWILHQRVLAAQELLETTTLTIEEVAHHTGFSSAVALRPNFRKALGLSPQHYRDAFGAGAWH